MNESRFSGKSLISFSQSDTKKTLNCKKMLQSSHTKQKSTTTLTNINKTSCSIIGPVAMNSGNGKERGAICVADREGTKRTDKLAEHNALLHI